jgi:hypothetical protein
MLWGTGISRHIPAASADGRALGYLHCASDPAMGLATPTAPALRIGPADGGIQDYMWPPTIQAVSISPTCEGGVCQGCP